MNYKETIQSVSNIVFNITKVIVDYDEELFSVQIKGHRPVTVLFIELETFIE
mgnify:CR=1 FL=1